MHNLGMLEQPFLTPERTSSLDIPNSFREFSSLLESDDLEIYSVTSDTLYAAVDPRQLEDDNMPVDPHDVRDLAEDILRTGQTDDVVVAFVRGHERLFVVNGYHRRAAAQQLRDEQVAIDLRVAIRVFESMEELRQQRIMASLSHETIDFARVIKTIDDAWSDSPWSGRCTARQAMQFASNPELAAKQLGRLPEEEIKAIHDWALRHAEYWRLTPKHVAKYFRESSGVDEALVEGARKRERGKQPEGALTPKQVTLFSRYISDNIPLQRLVAQHIMETSPKDGEIQSFLRYVQLYEEQQESGMLSANEAAELLAGWDDIVSAETASTSSGAGWGRRNILPFAFSDEPNDSAPHGNNGLLKIETIDDGVTALSFVLESLQQLLSKNGVSSGEVAALKPRIHALGVQLITLSNKGIDRAAKTADSDASNNDQRTGYGVVLPTLDDFMSSIQGRISEVQEATMEYLWDGEQSSFPSFENTSQARQCQRIIREIKRGAYEMADEFAARLAEVEAEVEDVLNEIVKRAKVAGS